MDDRTPEDELYRQAVDALKRKVAGYVLNESKKTYVYEKGRKKVKEEVVNKKEVGPDLSAIQFVLTNLAPARWNYKPEGKESPALPGNDDKPDLSRLSQAALEELNRLCEE